MRIFKNIIPLFLIFLAFAGCKELYKPEINVNQTAIVIQGMLTNNPGELAVKISRAVPYDSASVQVPVVNCTVSVRDGKGNDYPLTENGSGSYTNTSLYAQPGKLYTLYVVTSEGDVFESEGQLLPPVYKQDSIYGAHVSKSELVPDSYGGYFKTSKPGIETYVDLSSTFDDQPKCRYTSRVTVLFSYALPTLPPKTIFCWRTFTPGTEINVTTSNYEKTQGLIHKHSVCFFETAMSNYDSRPEVVFSGFLLALKKYNLTSEAYNYYKNEKDQMEASGKIFDPIPAQVRGNFKCVNNPGKSVYGFFEVTNVEQLYYRYSSNGTKLISKNWFPEFTDNGETDIAPAFWLN